ncbi:VOC family protein [Nonomuraea pusilla]|uniref:Glyoxalase-like domain-containing protein n=1 Tax=Nonomuraea pusilla TaxID=46177 RepID=A0A1H8ACC9_9ACTN|nr:VOC family protein [Nonomuraea pusilla]SEM68522.1 Glyoxalase-like domain-containing protein [Nonomuraea pusilla]
MSLDHLVYAAPDLDAAVADLERRLGVRAAPGGSHPGFGTRNRLIGLGGRSYLEIIGPDPAQGSPAFPRPFHLDVLAEPALVAWALAVDDIDAAVAGACGRGYDPGDPEAMARRTPAGDLLTWRLTPPRRAAYSGLVPFLIQWGDTRHPTDTGLPQVELAGLHAEHPEPDVVGRALAAVGATLDVRKGPRPRLEAVLRGRDGLVTLA